MYDDGNTRAARRIDELMMLVFGPPKPTPTSIPAPIDGDIANNRIGNLEWIERPKATRRDDSAYKRGDAHPGHG